MKCNRFEMTAAVVQKSLQTKLDLSDVFWEYLLTKCLHTALCWYMWNVFYPFLLSLGSLSVVIGLICFCSSSQLYSELSFVLSPFCSSSATWLSLQGTDKFCCGARQLSTDYLLWPRRRNSSMLRCFFQTQLARQLFRWVIIHGSNLICGVVLNLSALLAHSFAFFWHRISCFILSLFVEFCTLTFVSFCFHPQKYLAFFWRVNTSLRIFCSTSPEVKADAEICNVTALTLSTLSLSW